MRRWQEKLEQFAVEVITDQRKGKRASLLRAFLWLLSLVYVRLVQMRLFLYRHRLFRERSLGCLVVSIGNLTVGGTGKTPVVEAVARALQQGGRRVAILSRGYKSVRPPFVTRLFNALFLREPFSPPRVVSDGRSLLLDSRTAGDEPYMLASNLRDVSVIVDKDRVKSGLYAIQKLGVDTLVLDDGLQYLHLRHRLDIVLIDRQSPFGTEYLLPRGTLREPPQNLRRASYIFITKCNGESNRDLIHRIRYYNRTAEIIECRHKPLYLQHIYTDEKVELDFLKGAYIGTLCGIAAPRSFEEGLKKLGAKIELSKVYADHHRYREKEILNFLNHCIRRDLAAIITTEKDAVRFPHIARLDLPIYFLRVEIEILSGHETWQHAVERICKPPEIVPPERFFSSVET